MKWLRKVQARRRLVERKRSEVKANPEKKGEKADGGPGKPCFLQ